MAAPAVHLLIPTHTTRHLGPCLAGIARQTVLPTSVVVTCDTDDPAIGRLLDELWPRVVEAAGERGQCLRLIHTCRPHQGKALPAQVRNNGLRALEGAGSLGERDLIVGIDGDIVLSPEALARHAALAAQGAELVIGRRVCLEEAATGRVSVDEVLRGSIDWAAMSPPSELADLAYRHTKYERMLAVRRMLPRWVAGVFVKPHKPKLMSAHYAVTVGRLREVNGFDEEYAGYGFEDDDLGRRLHAVGARTAIGVKTIAAYHLWHATRSPGDRTQTPEYKRFMRGDLPVAAAHGWRNAMSQPEPVTRVVSAG